MLTKRKRSTKECNKCLKIRGINCFLYPTSTTCSYCNPPAAHEKFRCNKCNQWKTTEHYYMSHLHRCKDCYKKVMHKYYKTMSPAEYESHKEKTFKAYRARFETDEKFRKARSDVSRAYYYAHKDDPDFMKRNAERAIRYYHKKKKEKKNAHSTTR